MGSQNEQSILSTRFILNRYLQIASKTTTFQARARVYLYYAMLEAKIPVVMIVFDSRSLSAAFLRREYANFIFILLDHN